MATQQIPESYDLLVQLLREAATGTRTLGQAVGLKQNTEEVLRPELEALLGLPPGPGGNPPAAPGLKARWNAAKAYKVDRTAALQHAKDEGRALAVACVAVLKLRLGPQWNNAWQSAGFASGSLAIPDNPLAALQQLASYFHANPTHEVAGVGPNIGATAAACEAAAEAIGAALDASNQSITAAASAKNELDAGIRRARKRLIGLREELSQFLGRDDERWYSFGFDRPSDPEVPEVPEGLAAAPGAPASGILLVRWQAARRATSYRIALLNPITGAAVVERIVAETEAVFTGLASGQVLHVVVSARNGRGGESLTAPAVTATAP